MKFTDPVFILLILLFSSLPVRAQFYSTGEAPASTRWMQVNTPRFRIIYPAELRNDAIRLISELERTSPLSMEPFSKPAKPVPVLMHNTSVISNGYVTWAPRRMEVVATPPQDSYADEWIRQLALHEYRHVGQISQLSQGFTSALAVISGEIGPGSISSLVPAWFYEGDAVANETNHSQAGRGRIPGFEMPLRTLLLANQSVFSYDKAVFGSYRDFVPNAYQYGYQMVCFANERYGKAIWPGALDYTARNPYFIWPLAFYLKKNYGVYKQGLYRQTIDSIKILYKNQEDSVTYIDYLIKNKRKTRDYTSYEFPRDLGGGRLLTLKSGIGLRDCFVAIDSQGRERKVKTPGLIQNLKYDLSGNSLIWAEITSDPRWGRRDFSEIRLYDMQSKRLRNLTRRTRYFSPDFSPDGKIIAVAETDLKNNHFLTLISAESGQCIRRIPSPQNKALQFPEWISSDRIAVITVSEHGKQIEQVELDHEQWQVLLPFTRYDVSEPLHFRHYILFRSSFNNLENIYALDTKRSQLYQVTFSRFGAFHPAVTRDTSTLIFSDYSGTGHNITGIQLDPSTWKPIITATGPSGIWTVLNPLPKLEEEFIQPIENERGNVTKYHKLTHLFNFHAWLPFYAPVTGTPEQLEDLTIKPGFMLFSQNLLSTAISSIGYYYSDGYHYLVPRFTWRGWYPVIEASGHFGGPAHTLPLPDDISLSDHPGPYYEYRIRTYVPLVFDRGRYINYLQPQIEYQHASTYFYDGEAIRKGLDYFHYRMFINRYQRLSMRDLYPRWGVNLSASFTNTPADQAQFGSLFSLKAGVYIPGIAMHHHLLLKAGYQKQFPEKYYLPINRIDFPRGYPTFVSEEFSSLSVDYAFPLAYPDFSIGPVIYLKRLRADLFHDCSYGTDIRDGTDQHFTGSYLSSGIELLADFHFARIIFPVSAGIRLGYLHHENKIFTEFLLNIQTSIF